MASLEASSLRGDLGARWDSPNSVRGFVPRRASLERVSRSVREHSCGTQMHEAEDVWEFPNAYRSDRIARDLADGINVEVTHALRVM
jgi:hypothetical protein